MFNSNQLIINKETEILSYNQETKSLELDEVVSLNEVLLPTALKITLDALKSEYPDNSKKKKATKHSFVDIVISDTHKLLTQDGWKSAYKLTDLDSLYFLKANKTLEQVKIVSIEQLVYETPENFIEIYTKNNYNLFLNNVLIRQG